MQHLLYLLYSEKIDRFYVGETPNMENRVARHNQHYFSKSFTKSACDWRIVLSLELKDKTDTLYLEKFVKRMKNKKFIEKCIANRAILDDILTKR